MGPGERRTISLEVEFQPNINIPRPRVPQALNYDAHLVCNIRAFPPPSIIWKKGNDTLDDRENYRVSHFATQDEITTSTLKVCFLCVRTHIGTLPEPTIAIVTRRVEANVLLRGGLNPYTFIIKAVLQFELRLF